MADPILNTIVRFTISSATQVPSRPGFGTALLLASQVPASWGPNRVRTFFGIADVIAAGFAADNEARKIAEVYFGQTNRPRDLKIGRRLNIPSKRFTATITSVALGVVYTFLINGVTITFTAGGADTATTVGAALAALVTAPTGYGAVNAAGVLTFTATVPGTSPSFEVLQGPVTLLETTLNPGVVADLDACLLQTSDFYGLLIDIEGKPTTLVAGPWAESNSKLYGYETFDTAVGDPVVTNDILSEMTALSLEHAFGCASYQRTNARIAAGLMGKCFPLDPGSETWAFKQLAGVAAQTVPTVWFTTVDTKRGNVYARVGGVNMSWQGKTHTAWIDEVRGKDWFVTTGRIDLFEVFLNANGKIPYTDFGVDQLLNAVEGFVSRAENNGLLDGARGHTITAPKIATLTAAQRASRVFPGIEVVAFFAGAIHAVELNGVIQP